MLMSQVRQHLSGQVAGSIGAIDAMETSRNRNQAMNRTRIPSTSSVGAHPGGRFASVLDPCSSDPFFLERCHTVYPR